MAHTDTDTATATTAARRPLTGFALRSLWCCRGLHSSKHPFKVGDVIGLYFDMSEVRPVLSFTLNGDSAALEAHTINDVRSVSDLFPAVSVTGGAMLEANFGQTQGFKFPAPSGAQALMLSRDMI